MQRWEYALMYWPQMNLVLCGSPTSRGYSIKRDKSVGDTSDLDAWHRVLAELGADGWELASALPYGDSAELYFRRPME